MLTMFVLSSVTDEMDAINYYREEKKLMQNGGFSLRRTSNSQELRNLAMKDDVLDTDVQTKILGLR